ncbi:MAG: serine kinase [Clostridia bacterium]|nr:serine kinase [Clostridia bacterium]
MITVDGLAERCGFRQLTHLPVRNRAVRGAIVCDLLSMVLAEGREGLLWITVQTHLAVIGIACRHDLAGVIVVGGTVVPSATLARAEAEGMPVFATEKTAFCLCGDLREAGVCG